MKSTTKLIAAKKLAKLEISKTSIAYQIVAEVLGLPKSSKTYKVFGNTIRPVHTSGSGRFTSNLDYTHPTKNLLTKLGIDTILTNDSPRGGLTGNLLTITTKLK